MGQWGWGLLPGEREAFQDAMGIRGANDRGGAEFSATFGILASQQMALARMHAENLATSGNLKTLGCRLLCLDTFGATHKCRNLYGKEREI
jgi:hypothetical protein